MYTIKKTNWGTGRRPAPLPFVLSPSECRLPRCRPSAPGFFLFLETSVVPFVRVHQTRSKNRSLPAPPSDRRPRSSHPDVRLSPPHAPSALRAAPADRSPGVHRPPCTSRRSSASCVSIRKESNPCTRRTDPNADGAVCTLLPTLEERFYQKINGSRAHL